MRREHTSLPHRVSTVITTGLLIALSLSANLFAQDEDAPETPYFSDVMEVELVDVDIYVTDKKGRPVNNLTLEDFEVFEDGKPVNVSNFRVVTPTTASIGDQQSSAVPTDKPPETAPQTPSTPPIAAAPAEPLHLILYIDNAFIRSNNRNRVLRDLRALVRRVPLSAKIMVVSHSQSIKVNQSFTTDPNLITKALLELETVPVHGNDNQNRFMDLLRELEAQRAQQNVVYNHIYSYAQQTKQDVDRGLEAIRGLIDGLSGLPGKKAFVYASDGLPLTPAEELFHALQMRFNDLGSLQGIATFHAAKEFQHLTQVANTAGVTFYTIHAAGLEAPLGASAEVSGSGFDEMRATVDSVRTANFQGSGRVLAGETGGLAMLNTNDFSAGLGQMVQDFQNYYSIGYRPLHGRDSRYHTIKVKVKDKKLEVRHRRGYRDRSLPARMQDAVKTALAYGGERNPLEVRVSIGASETDGDSDTIIVPFTIAVPINKIVLIPREGLHEGRMRLYLSVRDDQGKQSAIREVEVPIRIPNEAVERALTQPWNQEVRLRVRPGRGQIAVGVWDEIGRVSSVLRETFQTN